MLDSFFSLFFSENIQTAWQLIKDYVYVWMPIVLFALFFQLYVRYIRTKWIINQGWFLLELRLPKEVRRSPAAMELVLHGLFEPVVGTYLDVFFGGQVRYWFSLEMVSLGGEVHFYIWGQKAWKNIVETRIYSQYPDAEVVEVEDYALKAHYDPKTMKMFGAQMSLVKADAYPIKTYIDYGLDKVGDEEEEKIDPLTPVTEFLGSLRPGEQCWIQILIQSHRKEGLEDIHFFRTPAWQEGAKKVIQDIIEKEAFVKSEEGKPPSMLNLTKTQQDTINAIQRSLDKHAYDTMIRVMYFAKKEDYDSIKGMGLIGSIRQFGSNNLNGIRPKWFTSTGIAYPWQDFRGIRKAAHQTELMNAYKRRSFFNIPYKNWNGKAFVMTTEELATIFHPPGTVATTPSLTRVSSKKGEAPSNLPI